MTDVSLVTQDVLEESLVEIAECNDSQWLVGQLRKSLELSVRHVVRVAAIIRRLEEMEVPITIKIATMPFLRKIAYGNMLPELYVALEGDSFLLSRAGGLPNPDQERIARNEPLKVMELNGDFRMVPPLSMTRREISQVFAGGRLRDDAEQVGWLRERLAVEPADVAITDAGVAKIDRKRKGVVTTGPTFLSLIELEHYVAALKRQKVRA